MSVLNKVFIGIGILVTIIGIIFLFTMTGSDLEYNGFVADLKSTHPDFQSISREELQIRFEEAEKADAKSNLIVVLMVVFSGAAMSAGGYAMDWADKKILEKARAAEFSHFAEKETYKLENARELNQIKMNAVNNLTSMLSDSAYVMDKNSMKILGNLIKGYIKDND